MSLVAYPPLPIFDLDTDPARSFPFLLEFTKDLSLPHSFENGRVVGSSPFAFREPGLWNYVDVDLDNLMFSELGDLTASEQYVEQPVSFDIEHYSLEGPLHEGEFLFPPFDSTVSLDGAQTWKYDPLAMKAFEIVQAIERSAHSPKTDSPNISECSTSTEMSCTNFFSPHQLRKFLDTYWERWYPNWPTIHRPLFDPLRTPSFLIAAMAIMGACHSQEPQERANSKFWANVVEKFVFEELEQIEAETFKVDQRHTIQLLQAACIMCIYQHWNGTKASKKRIRRQRFMTLVSVCRDVGISRATHRDYRFISQADFDWRSFVETEEMIRTFIWIYMIDTAFVIFNNFPPRMVLGELRMDVASPERCFQASSAEECFLGIQWWLCKTQRKQAQTPSSLLDFIRAFCRDEIDASFTDIYAHEAYMNYFAVTSALHVLMFNMGNGIIDDIKQRLGPVRRGLKNWRAVWNRRLAIDRSNKGTIASFDISIEPETEACGSQDELNIVTRTDHELCHSEDWRRPGFWRHASEYWLLCRVFLERMESTQKGLEAAENLSGQGSARSRVESKILARYDETDMEELHRFLLICAGK
ncbi:uncharacterized protein PV07_12095 [Cladophialophora immunda]|uniref:Xylanolytic transcriptional activator regulatory domain-containing protein n=1 Tax=Cladophialophora immunda TaxID=569365 RepID=A0A0D2CF41_9EURO|nr:uncharacterized protein PV07_12095 [Cladophialophora immunda]KIW22184.1 hypothetical protein PV07_12095 [Cladophialophora immunda]OQU99895.1 Fungal specific transcription factor domain-containing protein [Cladophialophora immunda]